MQEDIAPAEIRDRIVMVGQKERGEPVQVLRVEDHCIELDKKALEEILLNDRIRDKHVAVISLAGDFRKGKSFMLSFFLRFLCNLGNPVWLGRPDEPLRVFAWRGGCDRHTTGILIWKEVFLVKTLQGEELAVLLMDTQGMHDGLSTVKECASIFALSTMLSSVLVFNVSQNIQENDLQYLQLFTDYGKLAEQEMLGKPFQKLLFLVRDWYHIDDAEFGATGGRKLLEKRLKLHETQHKQLQQLRNHIHDCFTDVDCFLMPYPGSKVAQGKSSDGSLRDISDDFREQLLHLVPSILSPEKLIPKEINGQKVTCQQLFIYIKAYVEKFKGNDLPEPKTVFEATAEGNHLIAAFKALEQYRNHMDVRCGRQRVRREELERFHEEERARAMDTFHKTPKIGAEYLSENYQQKLSQDMDDWYACFAAAMTKQPGFFETASSKVKRAAAVIAGGAAVAVGGVAIPSMMVVAEIGSSGIGVPLTMLLGGVGVASAVVITAVAVIYKIYCRYSSTDTHAAAETADQSPSNEVSSNGQHAGNNALDTNFTGQCINDAPKEIDEASEDFSSQNESKMDLYSRTFTKIGAMFTKSSTQHKGAKQS